MLRERVRPARRRRGRHAGRRVLRRVPDARCERRGGGAEAQVALAAARSRCAWGCTRARRTLTEEGYVGADVHLGARIAAAGHGGQVLVSAATRELVELELTDLGEHG